MVGVHPIEHLRHLARSGDTDAAWIVPEVAAALSGLTHDRNALVMASRKLLERLGVCGPVWWLCGHALAADDARATLDELVASFVSDPTALELSLTRVATDDGPDVVDALVVSADGDAIVAGPEPSAGATGLWVVAALGTVVPGPYFAAALAGVDPRRHRLVPRDRIVRYVRPTGTSPVAGPVDVPLVPELLARH